MAEFVRVETDDAVATIRLDRPPMNALNTQVQDEIAAAAARLTPPSRPSTAASTSTCPPGRERLNFAGLFATEDQRTGVRSFVENGPGKATFAGR